MKSPCKLIQSGLLGSVLFLLSVAAMLLPITSEAQPVIQIGAGSSAYHSLLIKGDGSLWNMGNNQFGQLGVGNTMNKNRPVQILASNVTAVATGGYHSLFLKSDGSLWAMGDNLYGQLGDGTFHTSNYLPEQIVASNVTAIAAGEYHSLFLKSDGSLWGMGENFHGQMGDGTFNGQTNIPEQIVASNVITIAAGSLHSMFLKSDGSLWCMGQNQYGQLGDGTYSTNVPNFGVSIPEMIIASNVTAIAAGQVHSLFLKCDGSLWGMGYCYNGQLGGYFINKINIPVQIAASNVTTIAAGGNHSLFLNNDGSLWGMGENYYGELGVSPIGQFNSIIQILPNGVTAIAAGYYHTLFIKSDGSLWAMGRSDYGQLGDGTFNMVGTNQPEQIVVNPIYNQISGQPLNTGEMQLSFVGIAGQNYALDHSFNLSLPNWQPLTTNSAGTAGALVFTNTPDPTTNNFWRIRSMP